MRSLNAVIGVNAKHRSLQEKESLLKQLNEQREAAADGNQRAAALNAQKQQLEKEVSVSRHLITLSHHNRSKADIREHY